MMFNSVREAHRLGHVHRVEIVAVLENDLYVRRTALLL